jgi:hypothetical protein
LPLSFGLSHQNLIQFSPLSHACHMSCPPQPPWLHLPNDTWGLVQNMKPSLCNLLLSPKCSVLVSVQVVGYC